MENELQPTKKPKRIIKRPGLNTKTGIADRSEMDRILAAAEELSPTHWMICALMLESGMHPVMFDRLRIEMVKGDVLQWPRPKTGEVITLYIVPRLRRALEIYFGRRTGFSRQYAYQVVKEVAVAAGVPEISPITFRKSFCAARLLEGEGVEDVAVMMGCAPELVRKVYSALSPEQRRLVVVAKAQRAMGITAPAADPP